MQKLPLGSLNIFRRFQRQNRSESEQAPSSSNTNDNPESEGSSNGNESVVVQSNLNENHVNSTHAPSDTASSTETRSAQQIDLNSRDWSIPSYAATPRRIIESSSSENPNPNHTNPSPRTQHNSTRTPSPSSRTQSSSQSSRFFNAGFPASQYEVQFSLGGPASRSGVSVRRQRPSSSSHARPAPLTFQFFGSTVSIRAQSARSQRREAAVRLEQEIEDLLNMGSIDQRNVRSSTRMSYEEMASLSNHPRPTHRAVVDSLALFPYHQHADEDPETCSICLCDFEDSELICMLPCAHKFHKPCVERWLRESHVCPNCRIDLNDPQFH